MEILKVVTLHVSTEQWKYCVSVCAWVVFHYYILQYCYIETNYLGCFHSRCNMVWPGMVHLKKWIMPVNILVGFDLAIILPCMFPQYLLWPGMTWKIVFCGNTEIDVMPRWFPIVTMSPYFIQQVSMENMMNCLWKYSVLHKNH